MIRNIMTKVNEMTIKEKNDFIRDYEVAVDWQMSESSMEDVLLYECLTHIINNIKLKIFTNNEEETKSLYQKLAQLGYCWASGQAADNYPVLLDISNEMITVLDINTKTLYWQLPSVYDSAEEVDELLSTCVKYSKFCSL